MASQKKIVEMIGAIKTIYSYYAKDTDIEILVKTWNALLSEYQDEIVEKAFYKALQTCKMPPTPADVIENITEMKRALEPTDEEYWNSIIKVLRDVECQVYRFQFTATDENGVSQGDKARQKFEKIWEDLPDKIKLFLGGKGELIRLSRCSDNDLNFEKTRFLKTMPTIHKRQEYNNLLLDGTAQLLLNS